MDTRNELDGLGNHVRKTTGLLEPGFDKRIGWVGESHLEDYKLGCRAGLRYREHVRKKSFVI